MPRSPVNVAASIANRLRRLATDEGTNFDQVLRRYAIERLLYRLGTSGFGNRFVLKGATLFTLWMKDPFRSTNDLDLLGFDDPGTESIIGMFQAICGERDAADGLDFDQTNISAAPIRGTTAQGGVRIKLLCRLGQARIPIQVDIGFGDVVTPAAVELPFPAMLGGLAPVLKTYPRETVVAEKLHAIVSLGAANTRMKDFHDIAVITRLFDFDGQTVSDAIRATFARRATRLPEPHEWLPTDFATDRSRQVQWEAFLTRQRLPTAPRTLTDVVPEIAKFVQPPLKALRAGEAFTRQWPAGGPWPVEGVVRNPNEKPRK